MSQRAALIGLIEAIRGKPVLCVGDVMLDRFVHGRVERISPEAPIPVLGIEDETAMLGGAGNVVRNLVALGAEVRFIGAVGRDAPGRQVRTLLGDLGCVEATLVVEPARQTSIKTRFLAGSQQLMRADRETTEPVSAAARRRIVKAAAKALRECRVMVLSDYGKGVLCPEVVAELVAAAHDAGRTVMVDPKGADFARYRGADLVTPNRKELSEAARMPAASQGDVAAAARSLIESHGIGAVLATLGGDGMTLLGESGEPVHLGAEAREVFDVSGAGDTVIATLAAAMAAGAPLAEAAALANVAAGIVVGKVGTAVAYAADVVAALHHQDLTNAESKVVALKPALDRIARWRRKGRKIGFTNGCFDFLHPGHVSLLSQAREACDRLVVGLNSDSSVKRLKGPDRPVQSEAARATVLASLATVSMVVIFSEDTPLNLIEAIRPDVLVKGADYAVDQVVGADLVQGYGGNVLLAELTPGHSTSATIARITK